MSDSIPLDPRTLMNAYAKGLFPMANRTGRIQWYTADPRGIIPLEAFHIPGTLRALVRRSPAEGGFDIRVNHDFEATMRGCQEQRSGGTWISEPLIAAYVRLHKLGLAHSVEAWKEGRLAGGLYGVSLGGAFFGESMFHRIRDASKVALVHLVNHLRERNFVLLDSQASTPHLRRFGCIDISVQEYLRRLKLAIKKDCDFD
ncbi:MAG TPA: leucyl/phenylalanyl-tRNA--protein transferase [Tepidisphaeraceae bacterium]|jgi:leucyl/phenylalanyl-tRNA--protein transferase|nr:leucyl/phenylalanyl-tRNA--protein transferase [Tepidisphaeraceae bacterium]